jgi:DNA-binding MarR family transcriptional regulator
MDAPVRSKAGDDTAAERRSTISDDLLEELTTWPPSDRVRMFRRWHRGALSLVQLNVVAVLEAEGPLPMGRLADELDVSVASATGIVDRMERRGLVERRHATDDRRVVAVHLAEGGGAIFRDMAARRRENIARVLGDLTEEEAAGLLRGIRAIRLRLTGSAEPGAGTEPDSASDCAPTNGASGPRTMDDGTADR